MDGFLTDAGGRVRNQRAIHIGVAERGSVGNVDELDGEFRHNVVMISERQVNLVQTLVKSVCRERHLLIVEGNLSSGRSGLKTEVARLNTLGGVNLNREALQQSVWLKDSTLGQSLDCGKSSRVSRGSGRRIRRRRRRNRRSRRGRRGRGHVGCKGCNRRARQGQSRQSGGNFLIN